MNINYEHHFGLPRKLVWTYIKNEKVLKNSINGCKSLTEKSNGLYLAEVEVKMGPIQDIFALEIWLKEDQASATYRLNVKGKGNLGEITGAAQLLFLEETKGTTRLTVSAEGEVTGGIAIAGKRFKDNGAVKGLEAFFQKVEKEIKRSIYEIKRSRR
jgi:uncharacterized protein